MGAKKGLGATKVNTNFEEIEKEAQLADSLRSQKAAEVKPEEIESQVRQTWKPITALNRTTFRKLKKISI